MKNLAIIILAAGKGTRMKSNLVKVLHRIAGMPMLFYPLQAAKALAPKKIIVVVGHQRDQVKHAFGRENIIFVEQQEQLGSGHAVAVTAPVLQTFKADILIMCGDVPLITLDTLKGFLTAHAARKAVVSVLTVKTEDPSGYGRIIRAESGELKDIVEERDATPLQKTIQEINTGIYCCKAPFLYQALKKVGRDNDQGEYYLPDIIAIATKEGKNVYAFETDSFQEVKGINDRIDLAKTEKIMRQRILETHMQAGVTIVDSDATYIDFGINIGKDTIIYPNTVIKGASTLGKNCTVETSCTITDSFLADGVHLRSSSVIDTSRIGAGASIGPFAYINPQTTIKEQSRIGSFVEVKKSHRQ